MLKVKQTEREYKYVDNAFVWLYKTSCLKNIMHCCYADFVAKHSFINIPEQNNDLRLC